MNFIIKKELPLIGICLIPIVYLFSIWTSLPEKVPTHWNFDGQIDDWGSKNFLIYMVFALTFLVYSLMLFLPKIDPKKSAIIIGEKYYNFRLIITLFLSLIAFYLVYITKNQAINSISVIYSLVGILIISLGNYFKIIQPNYFVGIKTPWTIESPEVWKKTHLLAGKMWVIGGLLIVILNFLIPTKIFVVVMLSIVGILVLVPIIYSYLIFRKINNKL